MKRLKDKTVFNLDQPFLAYLNIILDSIENSNFEYPAIFKGIEEEDEIVRLEWIKSGTHTVLVIDDDENFYGFHFNSTTTEEASFLSKEASEAMSFLNTYIKKGK